MRQGQERTSLRRGQQLSERRSTAGVNLRANVKCRNGKLASSSCNFTTHSSCSSSRAAAKAIKPFRPTAAAAATVVVSPSPTAVSSPLSFCYFSLHSPASPPPQSDLNVQQAGRVQNFKAHNEEEFDAALLPEDAACLLIVTTKALT